MAGHSGTLINGIKNGNGKRERIDQEDDQEFMPLSKRINNIHLSPERLRNGGHSAHNVLAAHMNGVVPADYSSMMGTSSNHHPVSNGYSEGGADYRQLANSNEFRQRICHHDHHGPSSDYIRSNGSLGGLSSDGLSAADVSAHNVNLHNSHQNSQVPGMIPSPPNLDLGHPISIDPSCIQYRPSLNQSANPHYYEANRALFELYIERQMRNHQSPHPNVFSRPSHLDGSNNSL